MSSDDSHDEEIHQGTTEQDHVPTISTGNDSEETQVVVNTSQTVNDSTGGKRAYPDDEVRV